MQLPQNRKRQTCQNGTNKPCMAFSGENPTRCTYEQLIIAYSAIFERRKDNKMKHYNDMPRMTRWTNHVDSLKVISVNENGTVTAERCFPNGDICTETLFYSRCDEVEAGDYLDVQPILNGEKIGYKCLGLTLPEFLTEGEMGQ